MNDDYLSKIQTFYNIPDNVAMQCGILTDIGQLI